MDIHLPKVENWHRLNEKIQKYWGLPEDVGVRVYRGLHHAAFEIAQGTASFLSHKKSVGWRKGQTYAFSTALPYLYKEAFQVQPLSQKSPSIEIAAWAAALKKDTSFVMMNEDHPITGELFDNEELDTLLNIQKIFSLRVSHMKHWLRGVPEVKAQSVFLCDVSEDIAIAILGSKFKSPVQISSHFQFDEELVLGQIKKSRGSEDAEIVKKFESQLPAGFQVYSRGTQCLMDRSMIYHPEINGEALASELKLAADSVIPITNCAQGFTDWDWWEGKPTHEQMRGMLILDLKAMQALTGNSLLSEAQARCQI